MQRREGVNVIKLFLAGNLKIYIHHKLKQPVWAILKQITVQSKILLKKNCFHIKSTKQFQSKFLL